MSEPDPSSVAETLPPRRLDPRAILIKVLQNSPSILLALPAILVASRGRSAAIGLLIAGMSLLGGLILVSSWLRWRTFTYQILPGQLVIASGLINRTRRSIPAERIQDVSIKQGPLSRLLGLAQVRIETGGGEADEGQLDSVSLAEAYRLREVLRGLRTKGAPAEAAGREAEDEAEAILFRLGLPRLLYSGLFSFSLVWVAAIFGVGQYLNQALGYGWDQWLDLLGVSEQTLRSNINGPVVLAAACLAFAVGVLAGVIRTTLQSFRFKLAYAEGRFRYSRGLLTRTEVVVAKRQIQLSLVERGAVSGRLGWSTLKVQTLGGSDHLSGRQELVPFARPAELAPIIALAGLPPFERSRLRSVSPLHGMRALVAFVLLPTVIILGASSVFPFAALFLFTMPAPLAVALLRPRYHRYALAETSVQVSRGVLKERDWTIPYGNIQAVTVRRGPIQRMLRIATVRIDTAGGRGIHTPHILDIDVDQASAFVRDLLERANNLGGTSHGNAR